MASQVAMAFPVLPGKRTEIETFAATLLGPRRAEYEASQATVTSENWYLQATPSGDMLIVHFEAADPAAVMANLAVSEDPFDIWFKAQVASLSGIDLTQPIGPLPECVFHWSRG